VNLVIFVDCKESIQHIFFDCPFAKVVWRIIYKTLGWRHQRKSQLVREMAQGHSEEEFGSD
jgi:hypothetical protein